MTSQLREHMTDRAAAVAEVQRVADEYGSRGRWVRLEVQALTRAEFDSHDGEEQFFARTDDCGPFWSKRVELARNEARSYGHVGAIALTLMTREAPVTS